MIIIKQSHCCVQHIKLTNILYVKLVPCAEEIITEYQGGFWRGRLTVDHMFAMTQIWEKCWEQNVDVNDLFIGFQAAYDILHRMDKGYKGMKCIN